MKDGYNNANILDLRYSLFQQDFSARTIGVADDVDAPLRFVNLATAEVVPVSLAFGEGWGDSNRFMY